MERFQDENKYLGHFNDEFTVKCPKCGSKAVVICKTKEDYLVMVFECKKCFCQPDRAIPKYVAYGKKYCSNCFEKFEFESQALKIKPLTYKTTCPHCKFQEEGKFKIYEIVKKTEFGDGLKRERYYNLPLWFQKEVDGNLFWAYNRDHIDYLERYISAGLRERNSKMNLSSSLVAHLPQFVKAAKNREKLLKILKKWKE
nr:hypothetical protein [uncultured Flavobacterium sp.]